MRSACLGEGVLPHCSVAGFVPSTDDVLRCRARTTGIHETEFDVNEVPLLLMMMMMIMML